MNVLYIKFTYRMNACEQYEACIRSEWPFVIIIMNAGMCKYLKHTTVLELLLFDHT